MTDYDKTFWKVMTGIALATTLLIVGALYLGHRDYKQWQAFKAQHHCEPIRKIDGTTGVGFVGGKVGVVTTGGRVVYKCDGGMEYEKEE